MDSARYKAVHIFTYCLLPLPLSAPMHAPSNGKVEEGGEKLDYEDEEEERVSERRNRGRSEEKGMKGRHNRGEADVKAEGEIKRGGE